MNTLLMMMAGLMTIVNVATYADTGTWHRHKEYDLGNPRPAGQPHPLTVGR